MNWHEAKDLCEGLGGILPPRCLLSAISDEPEFEKIKKTFQSNYYWSGTEYSTTSAWRQLFSVGTQLGNSKTNNYYVRCVLGW